MTISRIFSVVVAAGWLVVMYRNSEMAPSVMALAATSFWVIFCLGLIWVPKGMSGIPVSKEYGEVKPGAVLGWVVGWASLFMPIMARLNSLNWNLLID